MGLGRKIVVSKMGSTTHFSDFKNFIKMNNKIPHYAREYKREYLFIRGLNKEFKYFIDNIDEPTRVLFLNNKVGKIEDLINKFLKSPKSGKFRDINKLIFWRYDILNIIEFYENISFDILDYKFAVDFYDLFCKFYTKLNYKYYDFDGNINLKECEINIIDSI